MANKNKKESKKELEEKEDEGKAEVKEEKKSGKKVLIVEDDKFLSRVLSDKFKKSSFHVVTAHDGQEAIEKITSEKPNIILLDVILPKKDGFEVLEEVKANPESKKIPVVILSNLGQGGDIERGKKLGAVDYLIKSDVTLDQITSKVKEYLIRFGS